MKTVLKKAFVGILMITSGVAAAESQNINLPKVMNNVQNWAKKYEVNPTKPETITTGIKKAVKDVGSYTPSDIQKMVGQNDTLNQIAQNVKEHAPQAAHAIDSIMLFLDRLDKLGQLENVIPATEFAYVMFLKQDLPEDANKAVMSLLKQGRKEEVKDLILAAQRHLSALKEELEKIGDLSEAEIATKIQEGAQLLMTSAMIIPGIDENDTLLDIFQHVKKMLENPEDFNTEDISTEINKEIEESREMINQFDDVKPEDISTEINKEIEESREMINQFDDIKFV